jgi:long-chain acyl-CoA synthetase
MVPRDRDDLAWLFYTSGHDRTAQGRRITHGMLMATSLCYPVDVDPVGPDDAALYAAPMSHGAGIYAPIHVPMGARHLCPKSGGFDADEVLDLSEKLGPTSMFMAPTMVRRLTDRGEGDRPRGAGIKTIVYGGGPMYRADIEEAVDWFGPKFVQIYGQGECPMAITALSREEVADRSHPRWRARLASVGRAQSVVEIAIGDGHGRHLPPGRDRRDHGQGPPVMPGYWKNPAATARDAARRLADDRRCRAARCRRIPDARRPLEGRDHLGRHQHLSRARWRRPADPPDRCTRSRWSGGPRRNGARMWSPSSWPRRARGRPPALDAHCLDQIARFKRPKAYFERERTAEEQLRQGAEDRACVTVSKEEMP